MATDPNASHPTGKTRLRDVPVRMLIPNLITLLALCAGLTGIRLAIEGRLELALGAIVFAAALDGIDGRVARYLKGTSKFGAELDSLADFVNFGVVPALILYFWGLNDLKNLGWIACLLLAIAAGLRLARFNVMLDDPNRPAWQANFFVGMPAPMGALTVLLPIYLYLLGVPQGRTLHIFATGYTVAIAFLMVSQVPVFSGKKMGTAVPRHLVLLVFTVAVFLVAATIAFPWEVLTILTLAYLASLPLGYLHYRRLDAAWRAETQPVAPPPDPDMFAPPSDEAERTDRPARLN
jgi:CDP-diacylglycerol--serine O-phosphatidyltransferase